MSIRNKIAEGQEVILVRYGTKKLEKGKVGKIKGSYFEVRPLSSNLTVSTPVHFTLKNGKHEYRKSDGTYWRLYLTEQDALSEWEKERLSAKIQARLGDGLSDLRVDQLRRAVEVLDGFKGVVNSANISNEI